jgi:hypothetical protein
MPVTAIEQPFEIFADIDGQPLEAGYVWIGQANLDPQTNPIAVFFDAALTIPATQPIRTRSGYVFNNETPARLYSNSDYSIRVMNKNGSTIYTSANSASETNLLRQDLASTAAGKGAELVAGTEIAIANYTNLRAYTGTQPRIYISGTAGTTKPTGIAGTFQHDPTDTTSADNGGTIIVGGDGRRWKRDFSGAVNVQWFGALGNNSADDHIAIQRGIDCVAAMTGGVKRSLYFPAGSYLCTNASGSNSLSVKSDIHIFGDGMLQSVIRFNDSVSSSRRDLMRSDGLGAYNIEISEIGFNGDWGTGNWATRSHLIEFLNVGDVAVTNCRFAESRFFALIINGGKKVIVKGCSFYRTVGDGCRITDSVSAVVVDNFFDSVNDDSVAIHSEDSSASPSLNSAIVSNNRIVDSQGICVLGAKHTVIASNSLTRCHVRGIFVGTNTFNPTEGNTALLSVSISNNVIDTMFDGTTFSPISGGHAGWIYVGAIAPTAAAGGGFVGQPNSSGGIVNPFSYFYTNNTDSVAPAAGNWHVNVSNNICTRSLAPVSAYSQYGFGQRYGRTGPVDPEITASNLGNIPTVGSFILDQHCQYLLISGNQFNGAGYGGILRGNTSSQYLSFRNVVFDGNVFSNFSSGGILVSGNGIVSIKNCIFDGDPYHQHPDRSSNGKWSANFANCHAIRLATARAVVSGCEFRNVGAIYDGGSGFTEFAWRANIVYADPAVGSGYDSNNIGVGLVVDFARLGALLTVEDGDPSSATFGKIKNTCLDAAFVMPSSGKYMNGHFVKNSNPLLTGSAGSQYIVSGWVRMTTGSNHVLNTDWRECRVLTGT